MNKCLWQIGYEFVYVNVLYRYSKERKKKMFAFHEILFLLPVSCSSAPTQTFVVYKTYTTNKFRCLFILTFNDARIKFFRIKMQMYSRLSHKRRKTYKCLHKQWIFFIKNIENHSLYRIFFYMFFCNQLKLDRNTKTFFGLIKI